MILYAPGFACSVPAGDAAGNVVRHSFLSVERDGLGATATRFILNIAPACSLASYGPGLTDDHLRRRRVMRSREKAPRVTPRVVHTPPVDADDASIIVVEKFIQATRDSGYKGTESAVSELVDNALQAGAKHVWIDISLSGAAPFPVRITVQDDGSGMDKRTLRQALRFGGSSRFNDRSGLGRYGMGLPNSSLSQARRFEVFTWRKPGQALYSYLDVDEIADRQLTRIPEPTLTRLPRWLTREQSESGRSSSGTGATVWTTGGHRPSPGGSRRNSDGCSGSTSGTASNSA